MIEMVLLLLFLTSCAERPTRVNLEGGNPPTFSLSGSGELDRLYIAEADAEEQPDPSPGFVWELVPVNRGRSGLEGVAVEQLGKITYGVIPKGYQQKTPASGQPLPLVPGRYYYFHFSTVNAPHAWGYFVIRDGKAQFATIRGRCNYETDGRTFKGPCGEPQY